MTLKTPLYTNPHTFFLLKNKGLYCWDYKSHCQYELSEEEFLTIKSIMENNYKALKDDIVNDLIQGGLLKQTPYENHDWAWDDLSKIYHMGVSDVEGDVPESQSEWIDAYKAFSKGVIEAENLKSLDPEGTAIDLPKPNLDALKDSSLYSAFINRMTSRRFNGKEMTLGDLSSILFMGFGMVHGETWTVLEEEGFESFGYRRAHPSGGALHPVEGYVLIFNVDGLSPGVYFYKPKGHKLILINENKVPEKVVSEFMCGQYYTEGIAVGIILTAHFKRVWNKYAHSRSYRDVFLDAGHVSQTLLLTSTALNIQTWLSAWYIDSQISKVLELPDISHAPLLFIGLGYGEKNPIPMDFS